MFNDVFVVLLLIDLLLFCIFFILIIFGIFKLYLIEYVNVFIFLFVVFFLFVEKFLMLYVVIVNLLRCGWIFVFICLNLLFIIVGSFVIGEIWKEL